MNPNAISLAKAQAELRRMEKHIAELEQDIFVKRQEIENTEEQCQALRAAIDMILNEGKQKEKP